MRWPRAVSLAAAALAVAATLAIVATFVVAGVPHDAWLVLLPLLLALPALVLGLVVSSARPANPTGALLSLAGLVFSLGVISDSYQQTAAQHPGMLSVDDRLVAATQGAWMLGYLPWALLLVVFPAERLVGPRRRALVAALLAVVLAFLVIGALVPPPGADTPAAAAPPRWLEVLGLGLVLTYFALLVASFAAAVRRYQHSPEPVRLQLRWLALAGLTVPGTLLLCWVSYLVLRGPDLAALGLAAMFIAFPVWTAVALLRSDLFDVDRVLLRLATYGVLTVLLTGVVALTAAAAGLVAGRGSVLVAVGATVVTLLALVPVRSRLERALFRRLYPARERAVAAVEDLGRRVSAGLAHPEQLEQVLREASGDPGLRVGYLLPGTDALVDRDGAPVSHGAAGNDVELAGARIGLLLPGPGRAAPGREVAGACPLLVEMVRLRLELTLALREVEASRERLLRTGYEERRRLERDLHDGAQQRLVSLGMSLRVAQLQLAGGAVAATDLGGVIDGAVAELATAVAELRQIAHGLRPSALDDGLPAALAGLTSRLPLPIDLHLDTAELPDVVSTTAYFVATEALVNAVKHAEAERIAVRVSQQGQRVYVQVRDDGRGGADVRAGGGLAGLADRVQALGGALHVDSCTGRGTLVEAVLPCGS